MTTTHMNLKDNKELNKLEEILYENEKLNNSVIPFISHFIAKILTNERIQESKKEKILNIFEKENRKELKELIIDLIKDPDTTIQNEISVKFESLSEISKHLFNEFYFYLEFGGYRFSLLTNNKEEIIKRISKYLLDYLEEVVKYLNSKENKYLHDRYKYYNVLLSLAINSIRSIKSISRKINITIEEIRFFLDILEKSKMLILLNSLNFNEYEQSLYKYCFLPQSLRTGILYDTIYYKYDFNGFLLEDYVCRVFKSFIDSNFEPNTNFYYESEMNGSDFLLKIKNDVIPIEVKIGGQGYSTLKKARRQVLNSMKAHNSKYGIIINKNLKVKIENAENGRIIYLSYIYLPFLEI